MNDKLTFTFTRDEINIILSSLGKEPYQEVFEIIHNIQAQAQEQLQVKTDGQSLSNEMQIEQKSTNA